MLTIAFFIYFIFIGKQCFCVKISNNVISRKVNNMVIFYPLGNCIIMVIKAKKVEVNQQKHKND